MTTDAVDALDRWLIDKDGQGLIKPPPGVVYDRPGYGIVFMDARGRDFTFADTGRHLQAWRSRLPAHPGNGPRPRSSPRALRRLCRRRDPLRVDRTHLTPRTQGPGRATSTPPGALSRPGAVHHSGSCSPHNARRRARSAPASAGSSRTRSRSSRARRRDPRGSPSGDPVRSLRIAHSRRFAAYEDATTCSG
jgi:hypothetical protein